VCSPSSGAGRVIAVVWLRVHRAATALVGRPAMNQVDHHAARQRLGCESASPMLCTVPPAPGGIERLDHSALLRVPRTAFIFSTSKPRLACDPNSSQNGDRRATRVTEHVRDAFPVGWFAPPMLIHPSFAWNAGTVPSGYAPIRSAPVTGPSRTGCRVASRSGCNAAHQRRLNHLP